MSNAVAALAFEAPHASTGREIPVTTPVAAPPNARPPGFVDHAFEHAFEVGAPPSSVWAWLNDPDTFVRGQVWPFRVEFVSASPDEPAGFHRGGLNIHHGPLMSLPGTLTEIRDEEYRDLQYFSGSYVLSLRLIRPTRLEFWLTDMSHGGTRVRLRLSGFVRRPLAGIWTAAQRIFWRRFGTPTKEAQSGTAHELQHAYAAWQENGRPQIMIYFNQAPPAPGAESDTAQWEQLQRFRRQLPGDGLTWNYRGVEEFSRLARRHLTLHIRQLYPAAKSNS